MLKRNRLALLAVILVSLLCLLIFSCKKTESPPAPWLSSSFAGVFYGEDVCLVSGPQFDSITITATAPAQISIKNLYGSGKSFNGVVSNDTCIIEPQVYNNGTGNAVMQGSFVMTGDTINLAIIVTTFGQEDKCNAVMVKK